MKCDEEVRCLVEHICIKNIHKTTTEMKNKYQLQISSELNKEISIVVAKWQRIEREND